jgi:hypothetical protein
MAILLLSVVKKLKKFLKRWRLSVRLKSSAFFSLPGALSVLLGLPSHIAAGKRVGRERGRPLAVTDRGLPLVGVRTVQV